MRLTALIANLLLAMVQAATLAQAAGLAQATLPDLNMSAEVAPANVRVGQQAVLTVRLKNTRTDAQIPLAVTASYTDPQGTLKQVTAQTILNVDASLPIRLSLQIGNLTPLPNTATFDGKPIAINNELSVDITVPGDGREHTLQIAVKP